MSGAYLPFMLCWPLILIGVFPPVVATRLLSVAMIFGPRAPTAEEGLFITSSISGSQQFLFPCPAAVLTLQD